MKIDPAILKERVATLLREEIAPALEMDGTAIEVLDATDGIIQLRLGGICSGCPITLQAVIFNLESELRQRVPEVEYLEVVP
jgi:Fe-S cluster biogenesis protein NfuA